MTFVPDMASANGLLPVPDLTNAEKTNLHGLEAQVNSMFPGEQINWFGESNDYGPDAYGISQSGNNYRISYFLRGGWAFPGETIPLSGYYKNMRNYVNILYVQSELRGFTATTSGGASGGGGGDWLP